MLCQSPEVGKESVRSQVLLEALFQDAILPGQVSLPRGPTVRELATPKAPSARDSRKSACAEKLAYLFLAAVRSGVRENFVRADDFAVERSGN